MTRHILNRLSANFVRSAPVGMHCDGGGLYLQVKRSSDDSVTRCWVFRFATGAKTTSASGKLRGVERQMGLGSFQIVSLADARDRASECRKMVRAGCDPLDQAREAKAQSRLATLRGITFKTCGTKYIAQHEAGWRNAKHREQWAATLDTYVYPVLGELPVAKIDTAIVLEALKPIWTTKPETAGRVRGRIEMILDWAKVHGYRSGENPARWHGHLKLALPNRAKVRRVKHHPALPYQEAPTFIAELRKREGTPARALEFTVLCAARTGAVIGATWDEIDLEHRVWTIPAERVGAKIIGEDLKPRRVPLTDPVIELLKALPRSGHDTFVFPGRSGGGLSNMAMLEIMRAMRPGYVPHGFRSTFKDWAAETTAFPNEVSEAALWHVVDDKVEAAYRRGDLFDKRRRLMESWAGYVISNASRGDVVNLRRSNTA
jgi:integrase